MVIVWVFVGLLVVVVLLAALSFARDEARLRRRAAAELPADLPGATVRHAKRAKLAELRDRRRPSHRPASKSTGEGGDPAGGVDVG